MPTAPTASATTQASTETPSAYWTAGSSTPSLTSEVVGNWAAFGGFSLQQVCSKDLLYIRFSMCALYIKGVTKYIAKVNAGKIRRLIGFMMVLLPHPLDVTFTHRCRPHLWGLQIGILFLQIHNASSICLWTTPFFAYSLVFKFSLSMQVRGREVQEEEEHLHGLHLSGTAPHTAQVHRDIPPLYPGAGFNICLQSRYLQSCIAMTWMMLAVGVKIYNSHALLLIAS